MSLFSEYFLYHFPLSLFVWTIEYVVRSFLPNGVFLLCDHGLDYDFVMKMDFNYLGVFLNSCQASYESNSRPQDRSEARNMNAPQDEVAVLRGHTYMCVRKMMLAVHARLLSARKWVRCRAL